MVNIPLKEKNFKKPYTTHISFLIGSLRLRLPLLRARPESSVPATTPTAAAAATLSSEAYPEPAAARSDPTVLKVLYIVRFFCGKVVELFFYLGPSTTSPTARPWKGPRWSRMIISTTITESPGRALSASSDHEKHIKIPTKNNLSQRYLFLWIFTWRIADSHRPTEPEF